MNTDIFIYLGAPAGFVIGILFCMFVSSMKKMSNVGFAFTGLFAVIGISILYIANMATSVVTNSEMRNAVSNIVFCGDVILTMAIIIFTVSLYIRSFENKKKGEDK
jgi:hypothetical protein